MGGVKLTGKIKSFDKFSLVLESGNLEQLIFKHAISTISVPRGAVHHPRPEMGREQQERTQAAQTPAPTVPSASGGSSSATSSS
jgi:host factor-I protein